MSLEKIMHDKLVEISNSWQREISGIGIHASDSKWGQPHSIPYGTASGWNVGEAPPIPTTPHWWTPACEHTFVDTGTLKSYCKKCNADAVWCSKELKFKLKEK